jgi:hypothetical protein
MRLLRDFFRLRIAGKFLLGRRDTSRRSWSITVPEPLVKPAQPVVADVHRSVEPSRSRPVTQRHDHAASQARGPMQLASGH